MPVAAGREEEEDQGCAVIKVMEDMRFMGRWDALRGTSPETKHRKRLKPAPGVVTALLLNDHEGAAELWTSASNLFAVIHVTRTRPGEPIG